MRVLGASVLSAAYITALFFGIRIPETNLPFDLPSEEVIHQVQRARDIGTAFMYWRGDHDEAEWLSTLGALRDIVESSTLATSASAARG